MKKNKEYSLDKFRKKYDEKKHIYHKLCHELTIQLQELLERNRIQTAFPIESRIKSWESIQKNCEHDNLKPKQLSEVKDIVGLRIILLFKRDLYKTQNIIKKNFIIHEFEDTSKRLGVNQFGYGSIHYILSPPDDWCSVPTLQGLKGLIAEVQVRTATQHIWAASSHLLQYKKELDVPIPLRRSINRVAALLETVDLEFDRVLIDRDQYIEEIKITDEKLPLNSDILKRIIDEISPLENKEGNENYARLLDELRNRNITLVHQLRNILTKHKDAVIEYDKETVGRKLYEIAGGELPSGFYRERLKKGVYFNHEGLCRIAVQMELGEFIPVRPNL